MQTNRSSNNDGLSPRSVEANVQAGRKWACRRDLPDVLGWKDLADHPGATFNALSRRVSEGRVPGAVSSFPLPKPGKCEMRGLAHLHPLDDLQMRLLVDRMLNEVSVHVHPHAFGARLESGPPGWQIEPSNRAWEHLREAASELIASGRYETLVKCDVRRCYPSITADVIERALSGQGLDVKRVDPLVEMLRGLLRVGSPKGLPIGPEASAVIAGLVLGVVDRAVAEAGMAHLRYSDDSFIFVPNGTATAQAYEVYSQALDKVGLKPNLDKFEEHPVGDGSAWSAVQDPTVSALQYYRVFVDDERHLLAALDAELLREQPNLRVVSFCVGSLRYRRSPCALPRIYENPAVLLDLPTQTGRYLSELCDNEPTRHEVDQDWLVEQAMAELGDAGLAAQLQVCNVASRVRLGEANGRCLEEIVTASSGGSTQRAPLRAFAAHAWAQSHAYRRRRAEDLALEFAHYDIRRALVEGIATKGQPSRKTRSFHQKMWSADHDLEPVLEGLR